MSNSTSKHFVPMANKYDRVVLLVDMDCFYCQVEEKLDPSLKNQPLAVVQYNAWKGGGIIAVNYAARAKGVTRQMRGDEAKEQCPEIKLAKVPNVREKADLTKYREAGKEVASVLQQFTPTLERASVDEAYLDITEAVNKRLQEMNAGTFILQPQELVNTYAVGYPTIGEFVTTITSSFIADPLADDDDFYRNFNENEIPAVRQSNIRLLIGASIANEIRSAVKTKTSYECSAGIAHNKILAKLACGMNKPNKQTVLPLAQISGLFETLPVGKIKGLGAKFGEEICERLNIRYLGQMLKFTEAELQKKFDEKNGSWLYNICRGIDLEAVTPRFYSKSIGCCKKFPGRNNITGLKTLQHWLNELANEIYERLEKDICENNRRAKQMVVNFIQEIDCDEVSSSRSTPLSCYDTEMLAVTSLEIIKSNTKQFFRTGSESALNNPIKFLGISVGKFETISNSQNNIQEMFAQQVAKKEKLKTELKDRTQSTSLSSNKNQSEIESGHKTIPELENNLLKQTPKRTNIRNVKSFFLKDINPPNAEADLGFKKASDLIRNSPEKMTNEQSSKTIKSFFLNALKKDQSNNNITPPKYDNNICDNFKTNPNSDKLESNSNITLNEPKPNDSSNSSLQKSFFVKALKRNEGTISNEAVKFPTFDSKTGDANCSELNNLIIDINNLQNEEIVDAFATQNSSTNTIIKNNLESNFQISDNKSIQNKRKFDEISECDQIVETDYRSQYVEFATPDLRTEFLTFTSCSKCGAKIIDDPISFQTHQDHHFAQELSKQQRNEYRDEIRSKLIASKSPKGGNKKSKKDHCNISSKKISSGITKFLKPSSSSTLSTSLTSDQNQEFEKSTSNIETCNICKLPIKVEEILEHKDFHMAKDLQRQLNQLEVRTVDIVKKSSSDSSRGSLNSDINVSSQRNKITAKPITRFFNQSNM